MTDHRNEKQELLALGLLRHAVQEELFTYTEMQPLLQKLLPLQPGAEHTLYTLLYRLRQQNDTQATLLAQRIHARIIQKAAQVDLPHSAPGDTTWQQIPELAHLPPDLPAAWPSEDQTLPILQQAARLERDRAFLLAVAPDMATPLQAITDAAARQQEELQRQPQCWSLLPPAFFADKLRGEDPTSSPAPPDARACLEELANLATANATGPEVPDALQQLVAWPDAQAAPYLLKAGTCAPAWQPYIMQALALRTGLRTIHWQDWSRWLQRDHANRQTLLANAAGLAKEYPAELALLWLQEVADAPESVAADTLLAESAAIARRTFQPGEFVRRWEHILTPSEVIRLQGAGPIPAPHVAPQKSPPPLPPRYATMPVGAPTVTAAPAAPPAPVAPSLWETHIQPFLAANWYILAGLLMVVAGASLLAYFTWDKSVLVRYLFLPVLLAAFTAGLAETGLRLFRRHAELAITGTFLLGGAICLLPANFMVLCRAGSDPRAATLLLPAFALYTVLAGLGLWRWCGAVQPALRTLLGIPLLAINLLAVLGDMPGLRDVTAAHRATLLPITITATALLLLATANRFLRQLLTPELLAAKLVPWLFGLTLAATALQVGAWRLFHLHLEPQPQDYALAMILVGATVLRWERRAGELRQTGAAYGGESFLGYAALLLGILMAANHAWLRITALLLAGIIWLVQAPRRPGVVHYWIGSTLVLLSGAAVGMLPAFPRTCELNLLPALGLTLALAVGVVRALAGRWHEQRLRQIALEMQPPLLLITVIVTVLAQYHLRSAPLLSGVTLLASALFFAVRASRENRRDWLHLAAICAAMALPYLGCADMLTYRFAANTLALGVALLATAWTMAARWLPGEVWRTTRITMLCGFGIAGIGGLILRLILNDRASLAAPDLAGGLLLAAALGATAWQARAQLPALLTALILAIILPLFQTPAGVLPAWLQVGTGMVSAAVALALTLACFSVKRREDRAGTAGVFSVPLLAAAAWLAGKALILQWQPHPQPAPFILSALCLAAASYAGALQGRQNRAGRLLWHLSWLLLSFGLTLACDAAGCHGLGMLQYPLLTTGLALTLLLAAETVVARRLPWANEFLVQPRLTLLAYGSLALAALLVLLVQRDVQGMREVRDSMQWLALFVLIQLIWHGLRTTRRRFGGMLFLLMAAWSCAISALPASFGMLPTLLLVVWLADTALERFPPAQDWLRPLRSPFVAGATLLTLLCTLIVIGTLAPFEQRVLQLATPPATHALLGTCLLLAARTQGCAGYALLAALFGYLLVLLPGTLADIYRPWHLATLALLLCLIPFPARWLTARWPHLLRGPAPQLPAIANSSQAPWFLLPGLAIAASAAIIQIALAMCAAADDTRALQIVAPFAAALCFALAGWYTRRGVLWAVAELLLPVANIFAVAVLWGRAVLDHGLAPAHIFGGAAVLTIAEFATVQGVMRRQPHLTTLPVVPWLQAGCITLATLTLLLLGMNYLTNPDLSQIPARRFAVTGLLALCAGLYVRHAARRPEHVRTARGSWLEALWHVALGLTLWCGALLIPALRTPQTALYALAVPTVACWLAAEWFHLPHQAREEQRLTSARYVASTTAFAVLTLVVYTFRLPCQMMLFPAAALNLQVYHSDAAAVLLTGLLLVRARGLGGAPWTALCGGLALITGLYFLATWLPGLSPFACPRAAAWAAVATAHLLILLSYQQSPLRALWQHIGGIGAEEWHAHRRSWGVFLTVATHVAVASGLLQQYTTHSLETTPLLVALASVLLHQALLGAAWSRAYWGLAVCEILLALHLDFLLPDYAPGLIPARLVVWYLLVPWLAAAAYWQRVGPWLAPLVRWLSADRLALICLGHLLYHGPATGSGLLLVVAGSLAALLTPLAEETPRARTAALLMLLPPIWLSYFGTRWYLGEGLAGFRPLLAGVAALLGTGLLTRLAESTPTATLLTGTLPRVGHALLRLCRQEGASVARTLLACAFTGLVLLTGLHDDARYAGPGVMLALALVWGLSCASWLREGFLRDGVFPYTLSVLSLAGAWIVLRRLLFLHFSFWTYEYDIWLSLGASLAFSAAKRLVLHQQPGLARTMTGAIWVLPVLQCTWLLTCRLNADLTLLVLGIQALLFAWQGGGRRDSPYNAIAILGFVGFVCLLFWARLDLRCVPAYIIPAGFGVLGLIWLFGTHLPPLLRQAVRLVTVCAMLGSCGYYALLDNHYPVGFHLTMLLLGLAVMALGPLLRVQLYLYLGFTGFFTDLVVLVVKQFGALDRSVQMMGVGALLFLLGLSVIGGAILCKTRRDALTTLAGRFRAWQGHWE
jgi:hypothetical protein